MKKRINTIFFGLCFIIALLIEAYSIQTLEGNLFSAVGLGVVVLITGYLFMDTIRTKLKKSSEDAKFYTDKLLTEETEKWNEKYMDLLNIQKATYTATKKNADLMSKKFDEVMIKIEILEEINSNAQQKILELQKKALEGQKKSLNLQVNYEKENAKHVISIMREELKKLDSHDQLANILSIMESNNLELQERIRQIQMVQPIQLNMDRDEEQEEQSISHSFKENFVDDSFEATSLMDVDPFNKDKAFHEDTFSNIQFSEEDSLTKDSQDSYGDTFNDNYIITDNLVNRNEDVIDTNNLDDSSLDVSIMKAEIETEGFEENNHEGYISQEMLQNLLSNGNSEDEYLSDAEEVEAIEERTETEVKVAAEITEIAELTDVEVAQDNMDDILSDDFMKQLTAGYSFETQQGELENTSESEQSFLEEPESEAVNPSEIMDNIYASSSNDEVTDTMNDGVEDIETEVTEQPKVVPLYEDPNKALSADEIAALFASFGQ